MLYDYNQTKNNFFDSLYTTNNQTIQIILNCMENTLINKNNNKIYKIMISRYFQMWRSIFYKYNSNDISNEIDKWLKDLTDPRIKYETFSYPIIFGNIQIYSLTEEMFINKFNFCIYLFYNLINYFNDCNNLLSMIFEFKKCKKILISFNLL